MVKQRPKATYDVERFVHDCALKGWNSSDLAKAAGVSSNQVSRFLTSRVQTPKMAAKLAKALNRPIARYLRGIKKTS